MNRIHKLFSENKSGILSVFYTAGFPLLTDTVRVAQALQKAGVDLIEIGIPFSDPVADGPTIQQSNKVALENGMSVKLLLEQIKAIREKVTIPIILMGYLNPVMQYGFEKFCKEAAANGVDGLILPDMPLTEYSQEYKPIMDTYHLLNIFLISPTTSDDRIRKVDALSNGFVYAVSSSSTTGAKENFSDEQLQYFERLRAINLNNPFLIGFGISNHQTFSQACRYSSGAIVGSAFIKLLQESHDLETDVHHFISMLRG